MTDPLTIVTLIALVATFAFLVTITRASRDRRELKDRLEASKIRLERKLQLARNERDGLLDALSDVFLIIDEARVIDYANAAAHRLFNAKTLTGRHVREVFIDPRLSRAIDECLKSKHPHETQVSLPPQGSSRQDPDSKGAQTWVIDSAPMTTAEGVSPATRIVMRDVTKEHQIDQIRKDFVANASHELRTPMAIIHGYLENLLEDGLLADPDTVDKFLRVMRKHSERMSRIIEDMLVISRLESGEEPPLNIEPFPLKECLRDILERLEPVIRQQQAEVELDLEDDTAIIQGDRFYWTQALFNLIENALKQNPRPGLKIEIGYRIESGQQSIWITDNGIGIPGADLPHIFRRFYRVDKQHSQNEIKGTGLGLSIVKRAIEAHQGTITATSIPGSETKFLIQVPAGGPRFESLPVASLI